MLSLQQLSHQSWRKRQFTSLLDSSYCTYNRPTHSSLKVWRCAETNINYACLPIFWMDLSYWILCSLQTYLARRRHRVLRNVFQESIYHLLWRKLADIMWGAWTLETLLCRSTMELWRCQTFYEFETAYKYIYSFYYSPFLNRSTTDLQITV